MSTTADEPDWSALPDDIVATIMSYLSLQDRARCARVCRAWSLVFQHPRLWRRLTFRFYLPSHAMALSGSLRFGKFMRSVTVAVNQMVKENRQNACALLETFSAVHSRKITSLSIEFTEENPLFYSGQEFVNSLKTFVSPPADVQACSLQHVDLSGLAVQFDDELVDTLSANNPDLRYLNLQTKVLICKVSPASVLRLVCRCRNLSDLHVFHCSITDSVLTALAEPGRGPLQHLSILCRREEKYGHDLSAECWRALAAAVPGYRVTLSFDHTCPYNLIPFIMKPDIPVETLRLETFARCSSEVRAAADYYSRSLRGLVVHTNSSAAIEEALLVVVRECPLLTSLLVYCVLREEVIEEIFRIRPGLKASGSYILKSEVDPEPWLMYSQEMALKSIARA